MGSVTEIGLLFAEPINTPLSTAAQFQSGCYLVFTSSGVVVPVYRDPTLKWPHNQVSIPGSGPATNAVTSGLISDATGKFPPIYLDPAIEYSYNLYSAAGALLESGTAINVANTPQMLEIVKISTTSRSNTTVLANDPDLELDITTPGLYRIEANLAFLASAALLPIDFQIAYSGTLNASAGNTLVLYGTLDNASATATGIPLNTVVGPYLLGNSGNSNGLRLVGTAQFTTQGTLSLQWAQGTASSGIISVAVGSALYATPL